MLVDLVDLNIIGFMLDSNRITSIHDVILITFNLFKY